MDTIAKVIEDLRDTDPDDPWHVCDARRAWADRLAALDGWRPIETAPKTSQSLLVWCPEYKNVYVVTWVMAEVSMTGRPFWAHFGGNGCLMEKPTHWMPLPTPPKETP